MGMRTYGAGAMAQEFKDAEFFLALLKGDNGAVDGGGLHPLALDGKVVLYAGGFVNGTIGPGVWQWKNADPIVFPEVSGLSGPTTATHVAWLRTSGLSLADPNNGSPGSSDWSGAWAFAVSKLSPSKTFANGAEPTFPAGTLMLQMEFDD